MYWSQDHDWYVKAGQMYLPFGFRLQDQSALRSADHGNQHDHTRPGCGVRRGARSLGCPARHLEWHRRGLPRSITASSTAAS